MKALRFLFCVLCPPVAVLLTGRMGSFIISLFLTLLVWIPGVLHAFFVVLDFHNEQRLRALRPGMLT
jgi:uncharacterized membrane protein YqaE (UPF0057 family)